MTPFDAAGPPDAPAIVLLHGAAFTRTMWLPQIDGLRDRFRVIAPDFPGHGALAGMPFRLGRAVRVAADVINAQADGCALVVGLSLGGYVAMELAHRHPERIAGLILSGCSVYYRGALGGLARINALLLKVYSERWLRRMQEKTLRRMLPAALAEPQIKAGFYFRAAGQGFGALAGKDFSAGLRTYPGPVLILNGENDRRNRQGEAALMAAARDARLEIIHGAGHGCNLEQPEVFTNAVCSFARSIGWWSETR
jgi:pimeloyl-ACP methyl ester carboxylesterase